MGRMKEYLMDMEEEHYANNEWEAIEHDKVSIFTDLFDLDDLNHFHLLELHMIDGSVHHIYEDMLELVTGLAIRWREPSQFHKGNTHDALPICIFYQQHFVAPAQIGFP